jgi:Family of unknown function (DUF6134)
MMMASRRFCMRWFLCPVIGLSLCALAYGQPPQVRAEETRDFEILVKGKPAGNMTAKITDTDDGRTTISTDAAVMLDYVVYKYRYEFHGREVWQGNQLATVDARAVDGGTQLATHVQNDSRGSTIEIPGTSAQPGPALAMTTNYWHAPTMAKGSVVQVLDADQGMVHAVRIEDVAAEQLVLAGRNIACTHYHLGGDLAADLWFDGEQRLVQEQTTEDGRPVETRLTRITSGSQEAARR